MDAVTVRRSSESSEHEYPQVGRRDSVESEIVEASESESRHHASKVKRQSAVPADILGGLDKAAVAKRLNVDPKLGIGAGLSEEEFRQYAAKVGLPPDLCDELVEDVHAFVNLLKELSEEEKSRIDEKEKFAESLKNLPADMSVARQFKTTLSAGALAYLTSFFFGKMAMNLSSIPTGMPHVTWIFLIAGFLNPVVTEPLVKGVRNSGAVYGSPDGIAYTEYHTAKAWMENTKQHPQECIRWRRKMAETVTEVLQREHKHGINKLGSGIAEIKYSANGQPLSAKTIAGHSVNPKEAEEQVILWARRRAYVTDELPFFFFSVNYLVSGALSPVFKAAYSPWTFCGIDLALSAMLGTLSGMETATLQNVLRRYIQGAKLLTETPELKRARQSAAYAKRTAYEEKMARLKQLRAILIVQWQTLKSNDKKGDDVQQQLKGVRQSLREAKKAYQSVHRQYVAIKRKFNQHNSVSGRVGQAVRSSMGSYMDEAGLRPNSASGKSSRLKAYSKLIGYPLSLAPVILWSTYTVPWITSLLYPNHGASHPLNASGIPGSEPGLESFAPEPATVTNHTSVSAPLLNLQMLLYALSGIPLIVGFTARQQYLSRGAEWLLVKASSDKPGAPTTDSGHARSDDEDSIVEASDDESAVVSSWSDGDSDAESDFDSTRYETSDNDSDGQLEALSRAERGRGVKKEDRVTRIDGILSDDDAYSTADEGDGHAAQNGEETSVEV